MTQIGGSDLWVKLQETREEFIRSLGETKQDFTKSLGDTLRDFIKFKTRYRTRFWALTIIAGFFYGIGGTLMGYACYTANQFKNTMVIKTDEATRATKEATDAVENCAQVNRQLAMSAQAILIPEIERILARQKSIESLAPADSADHKSLRLLKERLKEVNRIAGEAPADSRASVVAIDLDALERYLVKDYKGMLEVLDGVPLEARTYRHAVQRAACLLKMHRVDEAQEWCLTAQTLCPNTSDRVLVLNELAMLHIELAKKDENKDRAKALYERAIQYFQENARMQEDSVVPYFNCACAHAELHSLDQKQYPYDNVSSDLRDMQTKCDMKLKEVAQYIKEDLRAPSEATLPDYVKYLFQRYNLALISTENPEWDGQMTKALEKEFDRLEKEAKKSGSSVTDSALKPPQSDASTDTSAAPVLESTEAH